ncbi:hypothetical protein HK405_011677 [Cladochytrium tenue]|nr:hypothetical protein HK405_011677 [Cladochytrium tenue]
MSAGETVTQLSWDSYLGPDVRRKLCCPSWEPDPFETFWTAELWNSFMRLMFLNYRGEVRVSFRDFQYSVLDCFA